VRLFGGILCALLSAGCGASGGSTGAAIPSDTAAALAARAERVAGILESGACDQARTEALSLQSDLTALKLDPAVQAEAADRAGRLVAAINCPPPTTTTSTPTTTGTAPTIVVGEPRPGKGKKHKGGHDDHD
jgi:hypothetical protein